MKGLAWVKRMLAEKPESPFNGTPIKCGLIRKPKGGLILVAPDATFRGVRLVDVPPELYERYLRAQSETADVQKALANLDYAHRPRQHRVKSEDAACVGVDPEVAP